MVTPTPDSLLLMSCDLLGRFTKAVSKALRLRGDNRGKCIERDHLFSLLRAVVEKVDVGDVHQRADGSHDEHGDRSGDNAFTILGVLALKTGCECSGGVGNEVLCVNKDAYGVHGVAFRGCCSGVRDLQTM
jgi:hypothetical protein